MKGKKNLLLHPDISCGNFKGDTALRLHIFGNSQADLPPVDGIGDFLYMHNVSITEWKGILDISVPVVS